MSDSSGTDFKIFIGLHGWDLSDVVELVVLPECSTVGDDCATEVDKLTFLFIRFFSNKISLVFRPSNGLFKSDFNDVKLFKIELLSLGLWRFIFNFSFVISDAFGTGEFKSLWLDNEGKSKFSGCVTFVFSIWLVICWTGLILFNIVNALIFWVSIALDFW